MPIVKPDPAMNLWPIGHIADCVGQPVSEVERVIEALKFMPIFWLIGVPYFSMLQVVAIQDAIEAKRKAVADARIAQTN